MNDVKELFARLFVIAFQYKANLLSFAYQLAKSDFVSKVERGRYDEYFHKPLLDIFYDITGRRVDKDGSFGVYDDAYWCGYSYYEIHLRTKKPFAYILLKLPLTLMADMYSIYHEMDFSSLLEYFIKRSKEETILRLLCKEHKKSLPDLSYATGISLTTLSKYNASDEALYKASFQNIKRIQEFFDAPANLFVERISSGKLNKGFIEVYGENYLGYYSSTRVACRGIVIDEGKILLSHEKKNDVWMIPGGGKEGQEGDEECVIRELSEETGYLVEPSKCVLEIEEYYENARYVSKYFWCSVKGQGHVNLTKYEADAGLEARWIPIKEAIDIFSKHQRYTKEDEMKRGLYLREYSALRRILQGK